MRDNYTNPNDVVGKDPLFQELENAIVPSDGIEISRLPSIKFQEICMYKTCFDIGKIQTGFLPYNRLEAIASPLGLREHYCSAI